MTMRGDIVSELIARILEAGSREGSFTESCALEIERSFRQEFAGDEYYIASQSDALLEKKQKTAVAAYLQGKPTAAIAAENGISRATLYRYLKR